MIVVKVGMRIQVRVATVAMAAVALVVFLSGVVQAQEQAYSLTLILALVLYKRMRVANEKMKPFWRPTNDRTEDEKLW